MNFEKFLGAKTETYADSVPRIFDLGREKDRRHVSRLISARAIRHVSDDYEEQLREYFGIMNPGLVYAPGFEEKLRAYLDGIRGKTPLWRHGRWAYYPWLSALAHILEDDAFQTVRTARNRNLITRKEQEKFYNSTIGIAGLSVGNSVALAIVLMGGARRIKLADYDRLALTNINRIRTGVHNLGLPKAVITAREIYTINPYARVEIFPDGLTPRNITRFFAGLDLIIDEIDNLALKHVIREQAKKHRIAVLMGADNGDNAIIDIERYDKNPRQKFFHGRLGRTNYDVLSKLDKFGIGRTITRHLGPENVTPRMLASLRQMGKTVVSWPQLGGAALLNGCAVAYCARKVLTGEPLESNRALISLDEKLVPRYNSARSKRSRAKTARAFAKSFGL
jgi:molybdopterin/thiamine biosynthesis adenylyltransferase